MGIFNFRKQKKDSEDYSLSCIFSPQHSYSSREKAIELGTENIKCCPHCNFPLFSSRVIEVLVKGTDLEGNPGQEETANILFLLFLIFWSQSKNSFEIAGESRETVWNSHAWVTAEGESREVPIAETLDALESLGSSHFGQLSYLRPWLIIMGTQCLNWDVHKSGVYISPKKTFRLLTSNNLEPIVRLKNQIQAQYSNLEIWPIMDYLLEGIDKNLVQGATYLPFEADLEFIYKIETDGVLSTDDDDPEAFDFSRIPVDILERLITQGLPFPKDNILGPFNLRHSHQVIKVITVEDWDDHEDMQWEMQATVLCRVKLNGIRQMKPSQDQDEGGGLSQPEDSIASAIHRAWTTYVSFGKFKPLESDEFKLRRKDNLQLGWWDIHVTYKAGETSEHWAGGTHWQT